MVVEGMANKWHVYYSKTWTKDFIVVDKRLGEKYYKWWLIVILGVAVASGFKSLYCVAAFLLERFVPFCPSVLIVTFEWIEIFEIWLRMFNS